VFLLGSAVARVVAGQEPVTLERALAEARAANARLPISALQAATATQRVREARSLLGPQVAVEGDLRYGPGHPYGIDVGEDRLQAVLRQPLYSGGERTALIEAAEARERSARARARLDEKDLDRDVRVRYAELVADRDEVTFRADALERLQAYRSLVAARAASGQGVTADLLRAEARLASERAELLSARRRAHEARVELNDLMGRPLEGALEVADLPAPSVPDAGAPAGEVPDVEAARTDLAASERELDAVHAGRRPRLDLVLDAGFLGGGLAPAAGNPPGWLGAQAGMTATVNMSWPILDVGLFRAHLVQARIARDASRAALELVRRRVRRGLVRAEVDAAQSWAEIGQRAAALGPTEDAYLQEQALYRSGLATSLEVLDAFSAWRDARISHQQAVFAYRVADAERIRWSSP
jgi:outer membrane protein TolC